MKPRYTVRLTGELDHEERERVAARVAGVTEIDADKIMRLLERGEGKDLIRPSAANVANRLASVLAEAGAPVQLVPVVEPEPTPPEALEAEEVQARLPEPAETAGEHVEEPRAASAGPTPVEPTPAEPTPPPSAPSSATARRVGRADEEEEDAVLRPRRSAPAPSTQPPASYEEAAHAKAEAAEATEEAAASATEGEAAAETVRRVEPQLPEPEPEPVEPEPVEPEPVEPQLPEPERADRATAMSEDAEPETRAPEPIQSASERTGAEPAAPRAREEGPGVTVGEPPPRPAEPSRGTALLGAVGAALLGIGAFLAMDFLANPVAIGILLLAVLSLGLSAAGQRRAIWLPGLGALALLAWALANAEPGPVASLAQHWQWFAMMAGSLLVVIGGAMEARQGHGP